MVKKNLCIRCGECARACPVDAVFLDPAGEPFVCIHCGRCVSFCPHDCLEHMEVGTKNAEDGRANEAGLGSFRTHHRPPHFTASHPRHCIGIGR